MKGKTIGIPFGASTHRFTLERLKEAGLDPAKDVKLLNIDIQEQGEAIKSSKGRPWPVDAFASWDHHIALYESLGLAKILTSGTALGVIAMSNRLLSTQPELAERFLAAFKLAYYYYARHQEQADKWFADMAQGKFDQVLLAKVGRIEANLSATDVQSVDIALHPTHLSSLQKAADFASQQKLIQKEVDVTKSTAVELASKADSYIKADMISALRDVRAVSSE